MGGDASSVLNVSSVLEVSIRSIPSSIRSIPFAIFCLLQQNTRHCSTDFIVYWCISPVRQSHGSGVAVVSGDDVACIMYTISSRQHLVSLFCWHG